MSSGSINIITNVFVNIDGNTLRAADIYFNNKINEIKFRSDEIEWKDISDKKNPGKFISSLSAPKVSENLKVIDGKFLLLMPGAIDPHVHFDTPGFEFRDDFEHGTSAAAAGGVTTIIDMPCTSIPPVTSLKNLLEKENVVKKRSLVDFAFWGGVRGNDFNNGTDIHKHVLELAEAGVASFKTYLISGMETFTDLTKEQMMQAAEWINETGTPLGVHAEDKNMVVERRNKLQASNRPDWKAYCEARDVSAEAKAIETMIEVSRRTGCKVHVVHLSSKAGLELIRKAREEGVNINTETCPHYLYFTQNDFESEKISAFLKTAPPVKHEEDKDALWNGLKDNSISFVTTDHAGCSPVEEKSSDNFWEVYGGIPGVEHRVPFLFSEGFKKNRLTISETIELLSTNAAGYFKLNSKGKLEPGKDADFALIDLWSSETVKSKNMHSKGKYTPFENVVFDAVVDTTILRSKVVFSKRIKPEKSFGYGERIIIKH